MIHKAVIAPVPPAKETIPFVDMFVGLGSASHYLKEWFHPVAAFDSDSDAREVFTKFFPEAVVSVPALTSVAGLVLAYADAKNGSALVIARNHPWKSLK
jgi:hypothetical protein